MEEDVVQEALQHLREQQRLHLQWQPAVRERERFMRHSPPWAGDRNAATPRNSPLGGTSSQSPPPRRLRKVRKGAQSASGSSGFWLFE
eukprot:CAMPEP_0180280602 /NCGR_PEP_ID=MMETSP0988-20121125/8730_1 /TAXON_ID=697907 /ORGANISM="non described non described, Strain CCMP2293" /LENGTH=87 /DNA_ID=CAMNT_0022252479 /DNA_START=993 /DNA_END=1253 /DNA_ORIENTATION=-